MPYQVIRKDTNGVLQLYVEDQKPQREEVVCFHGSTAPYVPRLGTSDEVAHWSKWVEGHQKHIYEGYFGEE